MLEIARKINAQGEEVLIAGGAVRDAWLGRRVKDLDLATSLPPQEVEALFSDTLPIGRQFGIIKVKALGHWLEVATFRCDGVYQDARRPQTVVFSTAEEDAKRRDFRMNALFFDPLQGDLIDYTGGIEDLELAQVKAVGDPAKRFNEDALRLLRGIRFAAELGFSIEPRTWAALVKNMPLVQKISRERVRQELSKIFLGSNPTQAFALLMQADFWTQDLGRVSGLDVKVGGLKQVFSEVSEVSENQRELQIWALLFEPCFRQMSAAFLNQILPSLKAHYCFSNQDYHALVGFFRALELLMNSQARLGERLLVFAEPWVSAWLDWVGLLSRRPNQGSLKKALRELTDQYALLPTAPTGGLPQRLVTATQLIDLGYEGPRLGQALRELYLIQLEENLNDREALIARL